MKHLMNFITLFFILALSTNAQNGRNIYGYITDIYGNSLEGVSIRTQTKFYKTTSDLNGWFVMKVSPADSFITFQHAKMKDKKVFLGASDRIDVVMDFKTTNVLIETDDESEVQYEMIPMLHKVASYGRDKRGTATMPGAFHRPQVIIPQNTENYASISENGFKNVAASPLSTFSIDVDNAAYSNVRRFINEGKLPPVDAVRIEEMINYFTYDYPEPGSKHPFSVSTELGKCPWNKNHKLLHIGLQGKKIETGCLPISNLVFLLDVSGSMNAPNKLPLVKSAFKLLVNELRPSDKVSIVVYAGAAGLVLEPTSGNQKSKILNALEKLQAGGSTAGGEGILLAYKTAKENFIDGGNNRIILATDGDFNVGVSSNAAMEDLVEKERNNGVFLTVLGFGQGNIQDDKMETIANKGNGNYAYIDNIQEARKVFITEFGGTLFTIAKDVKFQLEFNPQKVKAYRLIGYENRLLNDEDFNDDTKDAGEMGAGHTVTALYEIIPHGMDDDSVPSVGPLKYQNNKPIKGEASEELLTIKVRYKDPDGNKSKLLERAIADNLVEETSNDYRFSAAVASFGMLIRGSELRGNMEMDKIIEMASNAKGHDIEGYRAEFINLAKTANLLGTFHLPEK